MLESRGIVVDLVWTEQLSVGNAILDCDHKELLKLASDIGSAAKSKNHADLFYAFKQFCACIDRHFLNEELIAAEFNIPFGMHKMAHQNLQVDLVCTMQQLRKNSAETIFAAEHYAQFLQDWLTRHITSEDMLMKPALLTSSYNTKLLGMATAGS